jgi:hypothetical protein
VNTSNEKVTVLVTQAKWAKLKEILKWLLEELENPYGIHHKLLEQKRGFLVHMIQTYPGLNPYLKGVHGTLDSWRRNRDINGFRMHDDKKRSNWDGASYRNEGDPTKLKRQKVEHVGGCEEERGKSFFKGKHNWKPGDKLSKKAIERPEPMYNDPEDPLSWAEKFGNFNLSRLGEQELDQAPLRVRPVKRLKKDVLAMLDLTNSEKPPQRSVRPGKLANAVYGFGNTSKDGFGVSVKINGKIAWRSGTWNLSMREESLNYREFRNLVEDIEKFVENGTLQGHELFLFTDNSTAEAAFFKGASTSEKLFDLVLRLRNLRMRGELFIHMVHISGTRMIWSGLMVCPEETTTLGSCLVMQCYISFLSLKMLESVQQACFLGFERGPCPKIKGSK